MFFLAVAALLAQIPRQYDVPLLENRSIRAHIVTLNTVEHYRSIADAPQLLYCLGTFAVSRDDGSRAECRRDELIFVESGWVDLRSGGEARPEVLIVELKEPPDPDGYTASDNAAKAGGEAYRLRFDNRYIRVFSIRIAPGVRTPVHWHPAKAFLYPLTSATLRSVVDDGVTRDASIRAREPRWLTAGGRHQLQNVGATDGVALLVELK